MARPSTLNLLYQLILSQIAGGFIYIRVMSPTSRSCHPALILRRMWFEPHAFTPDGVFKTVASWSILKITIVAGLEPPRPLGQPRALQPKRCVNNIAAAVLGWTGRSSQLSYTGAGFNLHCLGHTNQVLWLELLPATALYFRGRTRLRDQVLSCARSYSIISY